MHAYRIKSKIKSILKTNDKANCINMTIYIDNFIVVNEYSGWCMNIRSYIPAALQTNNVVIFHIL